MRDPVDKITVEVIRNYLITIADEMKKDDKMAKDAAMKKDEMAKDGMHKGDKMKDDAMKKGDKMKKDMKTN